MLSQACGHYIAHNASQMDRIDSGYQITSDGTQKVSAGFKTWVKYQYQENLRRIFWMEWGGSSMRGEDEQAVEGSYFEDFGFAQVKKNAIGQYHPGVVLHNIIALNRLLHHIMSNINHTPRFDYNVCMKGDNAVIEENKIYIEKEDDFLKYTVIDPHGDIQIGVVSRSELHINLSDVFDEPITEEKLQEWLLPNLLKVTSKRGHTADFNFKLNQYRLENNCVHAISETTPLGWYRLNKAEQIGNQQEWFPMYQYSVKPPMDPTQRGVLSTTWGVGIFNIPRGIDIDSTNLLLPFIESKIGQSSPLSTQISDALKNFKSLIDFAKTLPEYQENDNCYWLGFCVNESLPIFDSYLKGITARELKSILDDPDLSDEEAIRAVELRLNDEATREILTKNIQSQSEHYLKVLSVVSILIGVGIFTTLGLVFKRLYDSNGTSINFFKPLSENLYEDMEQVTSNAGCLLNNQ